jgi:hypothetical protein
VTRRFAVALLNLASRILPAAQREWARDMRGELDVVKSDHEALSWAFGCVLASVRERVLAMLNLNGRISRPVLILEWLMCFVPLTLLWAIAVTLIITRDSSPAALYAAAAFGTLGPIALIVSLTATATKRKADTPRIARALVVGFAVMVLLQILSNALRTDVEWQWLRFDFGTFFLLSLLPLLGALHFDRLAHGRIDPA